MAHDLTRSSGPTSTGGAESFAPPENPPGYELLEEIGRGGMGIVYRARDVALDRDVAVKLLFKRHPPDSPVSQRFVREARITGQLQHPAIPAVHQVGTLPDGRSYLVMKLIKGNNLADILKERTDPTVERGKLLSIFEAVCQAMGYAHAHRVIHRDLKPANIMVGPFGEVQVMDWGLAKVVGELTASATDLRATEQTCDWTQISPTPSRDSATDTQAGSMVGTPAYIPPEQALGETNKVDERADVFGLGGLLAVILTGKPPYVGEDFEAIRVLAARGKLDDCLARLEACDAEPDLIALCKRCLAFEPADRPENGGSVAQAVAELRSAADERARRAELDRVRVEGEKATAEAQSRERRRRRQVLFASIAALALAVIIGLAVVLTVQDRARRDLEAKNQELANEQAKVEARFDLAQKAISAFHSGDIGDLLLRSEQNKELRTVLLKEAAGFYGNMEKLLIGQTDANSRKALAAGYYQLAELTAKIGSMPEALTIHRKALAIRRELAAGIGADAESRLNLARSLGRVGWLLRAPSENAEGLTMSEQQRDLAEQLAAENPTDAARLFLAQSYSQIGRQLYFMGRSAEAIEAFGRVQSIIQKLADDSPANSDFQFSLGSNYNNIGHVLRSTGRMADALAVHVKALTINQQLANDNPTVTRIQMQLAGSFNNIGWVHWLTGKPAEALEAQNKALAIRQKLVDANPAVSEFQADLAWVNNRIGNLLLQLGKPAAALEAFNKALTIYLNLIDTNPDNTNVVSNLAESYRNIGRVHAREKRMAEAFKAFDTSLAILQKQAEGDPKNAEYLDELGCGYAVRGEVKVRAGQPVEAAADLRRAVDLWSQPSQSKSDLYAGFHLRLELARALALLAELARDPKSGVTASEAATFADQAITTLRDAMQSGWTQLDELKEPDFNSLRDREDFQKLLSEIEARIQAK